jgi:hypothetical protein
MKKNIKTQFFIQNKSMLGFIFLFYILPAMSQTMDWAYSFKNQVVMENIVDISSNKSNLFAIIGNGNTGISMDPINLSSTYNSPGNFVALYNDQAVIQWINATVSNSFGVKVASNGEVFVTGSFTGTKDFDPSPSTSTTLTATGTDTYLQKFNSDGTFAWAAKASAEGTPSEIEILSDGRIIVSGRSDVDASVTLSNSNTVNLLKGLYILEFSSTGNLTNAFSVSVPNGSSYMYVYDMTVDASDNIYLGGTLDGIADFDLSNNTSNNSATNGYDAYVVKYSSSFQLQWFKIFGDSNNPTGWDKVRGVTVDTSGNVFAAGEFTWTTDFDRANPGNVTLISDPASQLPSGFIAKWSSSGALNWVKKIGNTNNGVALNSASVSIIDIILKNDTVYTALEGYGYWDVDPSTESKILNVGGVSNSGIGFAVYSGSGNYLNAFSIDTTFSGSAVTAVGFGLLNNNSIVTSGKFSKLIDFDPEAGSLILETDVNGSFYNFDNDLYIAKYSFDYDAAANDDDEVLSVNELINERRLVVHPNPFSDKINITNLSDKKIKEVLVFSVQGNLIFKLTSNFDVIDANTLMEGAYIVEVSFDDNTIIREKLIR